MNPTQRFITELAHLGWSKIYAKYHRSPPKGFSLDEAIEFAKQQGFLELFVDQWSWKDYKDCGLYLVEIETDGGPKYEVFETERGAKLIVGRFDSLEAAVRYKLDRIVAATWG